MTSFTYLSDFDNTNTGYTNKYLERRNDLKTPVLNTGDKMIKEMKPNENYIFTVTKDLEKTPIMLMFFSMKNVDYLQNMIKKMIYNETGFTIGRQSDEELLIIMRSYYFSDAENLPYDYNKQVAKLNYLVLKYAVFHQILPKVKGYNTYLNDNLRTNITFDRSKYVNNKGEKLNRGSSDLI